MALKRCTIYIIIFLPSVASRRMTKIGSITKYYKISWNDLAPHQQGSHKAELHWSVESTRSIAEKESCCLEFHQKTSAIRRPCVGHQDDESQAAPTMELLAKNKVFHSFSSVSQPAPFCSRPTTMCIVFFRCIPLLLSRCRCACALGSARYGRMQQGFTSHSTQTRSFPRRSSRPISWLGT